MAHSERQPLFAANGDSREEQGSGTYHAIDDSQTGADSEGGAYLQPPHAVQEEEGPGTRPERRESARSWSSLQRIEKEFLVAAVVSGLAMVALTSHRIHVLKTKQRPLSSGIVMLLSEVFSLYYNIHGVLYKRFYELIIFIVAIFVDIIYCTVDFTAIQTPTNYEKARLGIDWSLGCVLPSFLAYFVITRVYCGDGIRQSVRYVDLFKSLLVLDLHMAVCSVVFIVTDRPMEAIDVAMLVLGEVFNLVFFCIGLFAMHERTRDVWGFLFNTIGLVPLVVLVYKAIKQKDGIAKGEYLDEASLVFSLLSVITRVVVLALCFLIWKRSDSPSPVGEEQSGGAFSSPAAGDGFDSGAYSRSSEHVTDGGSRTTRKAINC